MALLPTATELTMLRAIVQQKMGDTAQVYAAVKTIDDAGNPVTTWPAVTATYACRVVARNVQPSEIVVGEQVTAMTTWQIHLPWNATVNPEDRIVANGATFDVTDEDSPKSTRLEVVVNCRRVRSG